MWNIISHERASDETRHQQSLLNTSRTILWVFTEVCKNFRGETSISTLFIFHQHTRDQREHHEKCTTFWQWFWTRCLCRETHLHGLLSLVFVKSTSTSESGGSRIHAWFCVVQKRRSDELFSPAGPENSWRNPTDAHGERNQSQNSWAV